MVGFWYLLPVRRFWARDDEGENKTGDIELAEAGFGGTLYDKGGSYSFYRFAHLCCRTAVRLDYSACSWEVSQVEPIRVLIVDDEVEFLETLVKRLKKRNLTVNGVTSGEAALELLNTSPVDVVVLDVKMPGMSGLDTLREIRKGQNPAEVIMLTGHASVEAAIEGMAVGAFDYLMKPTQIDELVYKIQDAYKKIKLAEKKNQLENQGVSD
jgi:ActR/RegA family two-component response regulator